MYRAIILIFLAFLVPLNALGDINVLVTIKPLQLIVKSVLGSQGNISVIMPVSSSPHHYNLSPSDRVAMESADLIVYVGQELETQFDGVIRQIGSRENVLELLSLPALTRLPLAENDLVQSHQGEGRYDPHIWLDTNNAVLIAGAIKDRLAEVNPAQTDVFTRNFTLFRDSMSRLEEQLRFKIQATTPVSYVVYHNAIAYLELQFGLSHSFSLVSDPESAPGIRQISEVRELVSTIKPSCLFTDETSNEALIRTMLSGHLINSIRLDLLGKNLTDNQGYEQLIDNLISDIVSCF